MGRGKGKVCRNNIVHHDKSGILGALKKTGMKLEDGQCHFKAHEKRFHHQPHRR
jgi:hypothetical protein